MTTRKKLNIMVFPPLDNWEEITKLTELGHSIFYPDLGNQGKLWPNMDLVLGPNCWRMDELHRKYLNLAIKVAKKALTK